MNEMDIREAAIRDYAEQAEKERPPLTMFTVVWRYPDGYELKYITVYAIDVEDARNAVESNYVRTSIIVSAVVVGDWT